jgi:site-specific DNA recombinase
VSVVTTTAPSNDTIRAAIYVRISSDDTRDELGVRRQERNCRDLVERQGWTVVDIYCDNDRSASKVGRDLAPLARPAFTRLMADVRVGKIDVIVTQNQDRLSRLTDEIEVVARTLRSVGHTGWWTVAAGEQRIDSTNARLGYRVKGLFDAAYSEYISEKVKEKKTELALAGLPSGGGGRAYGYGDDKVTVIDDEADVIRNCAARVIAGESIYGITKGLNERGVPTVSGSPWRPKVLRDLLTSHRVAGLRSHKGEVVGAAAWPAILPRETWEVVGATLGARAFGEGRPMARRLLTGVLVCELCGANLVGGLNNGRPSYGCRRALGGCERVAIAAEPIDEYITESVLAALDTPAVAVKIAQQPRGDAAKVLVLEARKAELAEVFAAGEIDRAQLAAATRRLDADLAATRGALAVDDRAALLAPYLNDAGLLRREWPNLADTQRRGIIAALVERAVVGRASRGRWTTVEERVPLHNVTWRG